MTKSIYDRLFKFLIRKCNETLDTNAKKSSFAGVLDIAGFEIFDENGFDQLCINFTNEKLQQVETLGHIFKFFNLGKLKIIMHNFYSFSIITCSFWNKKNTKRKVWIGFLKILAWTCKLASLSWKCKSREPNFS